MSSFEVDYSKLKTRSSELATIYKTINSLKQQLENCNTALRYCLSSESYANIKKSISAASSSLQQQSSHLSALSSGLGQVSSTYSSTEKKILAGKFSLADILKAFTGTALSIIGGASLNDSLISGAVSGKTSILGIGIGGTISGSILGYDTSAINKWKFEKDEDGNLKDASAELGVSGSVYGLKGKLEGNIGKLSGSMEGSVGNVGASGALGATLFKNGKLHPSVSAELKAKANVAEGEIKGQLGTKDYNAHAKASGEFLGASAEASAHAGYITYKVKDKNGNEVEETAVGVQGKVGAEAYVAQGTASGGITILGVKIDASVTGKAGGAGVSAEGHIGSKGVSGSIGAGLGVGGGVSISVDWSGAVENVTKNWNKISSNVSKGWNTITSGVSKLKFW